MNSSGNYAPNTPLKTNWGHTELSFLKFNGILKEIIERYPNIDTAAFLEEKLQLSPEKAEDLAARIEKKYCLNASKIDQKPLASSRETRRIRSVS